MKIESIERAQSPTGKLRLRFSNNKSTLVYPAVIADLGLYEGRELSQEEADRLCCRAAEASAQERAVRIVAASSVTEKELLHRLVQKGENPEHAQQAVDRLKELKLLDDAQTARQIVRSGLAKGYGEGRLRQLLYEKRVPKSLWQQALEDLPEPDDKIQEFLQKRFRKGEPDPIERKRATDALLRRGYRWGDIRRAMEHYGEAEAYEDYEE